MVFFWRRQRRLSLLQQHVELLDFPPAGFQLNVFRVHLPPQYLHQFSIPVACTFRLYFVYTIRQFNYPDESLRGFFLDSAQFPFVYTPSNRRLNNA